jgi:hypothetical protein
MNRIGAAGVTLDAFKTMAIARTIDRARCGRAAGSL